MKKTLYPLHSSTPPLSKPWKETTKRIPPSSNLIVDGLLDKIDLTLTL